jgi:tetratricopeptide (TPR) repeat protein
MEQDYAASPSLDVSPLPEAAAPPAGLLQEAVRYHEAGHYKEVVKLLSAMQAVTPMEKAWHRLLLGQAYLEIGARDKGLRLLQANYEELRDSRPTPEPERVRILARSLKPLGDYYRDNKDPERALTLHQLQWLYMKRFGSLSDRFDALLNLDGDATALRHYFASEQWLREALLVAQQMPEGGERQRSRLIAWNHLAMSLSELLRFPEAEAAARESRRISQVYDASSGKKEYREIAAIAGQADVHGAWARVTEAKNPLESKPLYAKAQAFAIEAMALAEQQGMVDPGRARLEQNMRVHCGSSCRP